MDPLQYHSQPVPGKLEIKATKPCSTQKELSLAYSPGVAEPCIEIEQNPIKANLYTNKGNLVAVISNGTAVLGLGNIGALASKPVMEGKAVLFKRFADVDVYDIELETEDSDKFITAVELMAPTFGGINLEDIKAPECFYIEEELKKRMSIPVFHDDQHGTAIISGAALLNAMEITGKSLDNLKVVVNGAGAAGIACTQFYIDLGIKKENITLCDRTGVIYKGRTEGMNEYKARYTVETEARTLSDAIAGADLFLGLSVAGALTPDMLKSMNGNPIVFALANPVPEIMPEEAIKVRNDALIATGRSDFPNQVNNVLGFPFIFRGALDVQASDITSEMKVAAAHALARLTKEPVPDYILKAYNVDALSFGPDYLIPKPFDKRVFIEVSVAVASEAVKSGVARADYPGDEAYRESLEERYNNKIQPLNE